MPRTRFYGNKIVKAAIQPNIGLDAAACQSVVEMLNLLLADESVLALKTCCADVPELQSLYDAQHKQITAISAELTERIQILGGSPLVDSQVLIDTARLGSEGKAAQDILSVLTDYEAFIRFLREDTQQIFELYEDQGTFALLVSILRIHERMAWILRSNIAVEQFKNDQWKKPVNEPDEPKEDTLEDAVNRYENEGGQNVRPSPMMGKASTK